jgi:hypothetical protein
MRPAGALLAALLLAGCAATPKKPACPAGQELLPTAQLFLGQKAPGVAARPADLRRFVDEEITPRFPDGVTVLDGGVQWQGAEDRLMREAAKVVLIVLPPGGDPYGRVEAVRSAYRSRFKQDAVLVMTQPACVAF